MNVALRYRGLSIPAWIVSITLLAALFLSACGSEPQADEQRQAANEERAPAFELPAARGGMTSLAQLLEGRDALTLVFYRGFF